MFDTLAPDNTYYPCGGYTVGIVPFKGLLEIASQFVAGASGNLATVDLGLLYFSGFQALPVNVYLYGDADGLPDNGNQTFLGSGTPTAEYDCITNNSLVSFAVSDTVPVTLGTTYWLVLKPAVTNESNSWNFAFPWVPGSLAGSYDDSTWSGGPTPQLPAFRLTARNATVTVQMMRGVSDSVFVNPSGGIDDPLEPIPDAGVLNNPTNQLPVSQGLVADGVTPLLFKFEQAAPAQATYDVTIDSEGSVASLYLLNGNQWIRIIPPNAGQITFDGTTTTAFAYVAAPDLTGLSGTEFQGTLTLTDHINPVITKTFYVRRPPIFLVHGYASNGSTWTSDFKDALAPATQSDFVNPISYGAIGSSPFNYFNTWGSFAALVPELDGALNAQEASLHQGWAFTRYDVVAHSQGGILTRLLCGQFEFKGPTNFYRGRFRRVITIGSPHNGSTMAYYVSHLNGVYGYLPFFLRALDILEPKFDPFGDQIHAINDASANVDPDAKFHLIADTINGGDVTQYSLPLCYLMTGLSHVSNQYPSPTTRGEVVLDNGSDGVVDIQSEKGGRGTPLSEIQGVDIAHLMLPGGLNFPAFGTLRSDTTDGYVGSQVATLLTGSANEFGLFQSPVPLSLPRKAEIDAEIPYPVIIDLIIPGPLHRPAIPSVGANSYTFMFTPDPNEPLDGTANWYAEVFSPEGVTTAGLTVTPDPSDSTHVTVDVDDSVLGDVALYLSYNSTTGHLILGSPVLVVSIPPGANLTGIELHPNPITAMVGDAIGLEIWGLYDNGSTSQLFVQPQNSTFSSSDPNVALVDSATGLLSAVRPGDATITATYGGVTNEATIHVVPVPRAIPTPRPRATPRSRPTPPPHITPVPPPPSPRPTPAPRP